MYQINIRAWDEENNVMLYPEIHEGALKLFIPGELTDGTRAWCDFNKAGLIKMFGFENKITGNIVYEGDVIRHNGEMYACICEDGKIHGLRLPSLDLSIPLSVMQMKKVVGNTYEKFKFKPSNKRIGYKTF